VHDLLISKYVANREKDRRFARAAMMHKLVHVEILLSRLRETELAAAIRTNVRELIIFDTAQVSST
jgi:hypothetical protein